MSINTNKFSYKDKINAISSYFGISDPAAKYMYHRRRRGHPYKNITDDYFLEWNMKLQNAFIKADQIATFDWDALRFGDDVKALIVNGIDIDDQPHRSQVNKINQGTRSSTKQTNVDGKSVTDESDNDWTVVTTNKGQLAKKHILRKMGFLPHTKSDTKKSVRKDLIEPPS